MPGRTRALATRVLSRDVCLLACAMLASAACQSEGHAPYYDPNAVRDDGGQYFRRDAGADAGPRHGDGGTLTGEPVPGMTSGRPDPTDFDQHGDPIFDPEQVYLHGYFAGSEFAVDVRAGPCDDGVSAIADWSYPKKNWHTTDGVTVAIPCDTEDVQVRADGSVLYGYDTYGPRAFVREPPSIDANAIIIPGQAPEANVADPTINPCVGVGGFQSFVLDPMNGAMVANCAAGGEKGIVHPLLGFRAKPATTVDIPPQFSVMHLGYDGAALLRKAGTDEIAVWTAADKVVELGEAPFEFGRLAAVRADADAFVLLVIASEDPPALERWRLSYQGRLKQEPDDYPSASEGVLDVSECVARNGLAWALVTDPTLKPDYSATLGCACALEPEEVALCIVRDSKDDSVVLRFEPGQGDAAEVFRLSDQDPFFLTKLKGFFTGN